LQNEISQQKKNRFSIRDKSGTCTLHHACTCSLWVHGYNGCSSGLHAMCILHIHIITSRRIMEYWFYDASCHMCFNWLRQ